MYLTTNLIDNQSLIHANKLQLPMVSYGTDSFYFYFSVILRLQKGETTDGLNMAADTFAMYVVLIAPDVFRRLVVNNDTD